jgi:hypothetical protein
MRKLFLAVSGLFSLIPGIAVMIKVLGSPPDHNISFGAVIEVFGTLSLLVLFMNKPRIVDSPVVKITRWVILLAALSIITLVIYIALFNFCVVSVKDRGTVYYPVYTSGNVAIMIERAGSRSAAIERYGIDAVTEAVNEMPGIPIALTTILLLLVYLLIFTPLVLAFGFLGIRQEKETL